MQLDLTDKRILELLQENSQFTMKEIASRINLSVTPVHDRIRKLEREGFIDKYVCLLNRVNLEKPWLYIVTLHWISRNGKALKILIRRLSECPKFWSVQSYPGTSIIC